MVNNVDTQLGLIRTEFERYFSDNGQFPLAVERNGDGYKLMQAQSAWVTWQHAWGCCIMLKYER